MINKKEFGKYKSDVKRIRNIAVDMQKYVMEHELKINRELATSVDLKL